MIGANPVNFRSHVRSSKSCHSVNTACGFCFPIVNILLFMESVLDLTKVVVNIVNRVAQVEIEQHYVKTNDAPLECNYHFPLCEGAVVYYLEGWIFFQIIEHPHTMNHY